MSDPRLIHAPPRTGAPMERKGSPTSAHHVPHWRSQAYTCAPLARHWVPVGRTWALVGRMRAPPAPTCAPLSPTCAPRCASERRSGMLMLVVVRPSGGVVVLVISKKAPRPEWLFPLPEWLGVAPSGSEWLRPVPGPRSAACELRLKDSACGLAHPPLRQQRPQGGWWGVHSTPHLLASLLQFGS